MLQAEFIAHGKLGMYEMSLQRKRILTVGDNANDWKHDEQKLVPGKQTTTKIPSYPIYLIKLAKLIII